MRRIMNNILFLVIGIMVGWFADRVLITLRGIYYRLRTREPESGIVGDGGVVAQPVSSRTVSSAGAVIDPMTEEELIAQTNKEVRRMNGRT